MFRRKRTIFIGDVHGCLDELKTLIKKIDPQPKDEIIFIGDLIRKGPDSLGVNLYFKELDAISLLGNHEWSIREQLAGRCPKRSSLKEVKKDFGKHFKAFATDLKSWPVYIERRSFVAVHAGVAPGIALHNTEEWALVTIRTWDGEGHDLQHAENPHWYTFYKRKKPVIFGHWAALRGLKRHNVIGLDTGCVYGGKLTAYILPEKRFVTVKAKKKYSGI